MELNISKIMANGKIYYFNNVRKDGFDEILNNDLLLNLL